MAEKFRSVIQRISLSSLSSLQLFQLIRYATFIVIGIGFAKLYLSLRDIGSFETFVMISGMVSYFWVSGIITTMLSAYPKKSESEKKELLFNTFISLLYFSVLAVALLFIFSQNILSFLDKESNGNIIQLAAVYLIFNSPSFITEYVLFLNEKKKEIVYYGIVSFIITVAAALVPALLGFEMEYWLYGMIAVSALKFLFALFILSRYANFNFNFQLQLSAIKLSLPLLLSILVSGSAEYIDGIIVKTKYDDVSFAVFRYGAKELPVLLIIANTLSTAMVPVIAGNLNAGLAELKKKSALLMHLFFPLSIALMLTSRFIFQYVLSDSFIFSAFIFNIYLLLIIPRVLFPQTVLTGLQRTKFLLVSSVIEITLNILLSVWLAGKIGLPGIALGTFIAYTFDKVFLIAVNYFVYKISPARYLSVRLFIIYTVVTVIVFGISYYAMIEM